MTEVFVERTWPAPITDEGMQMMSAMFAGCLGLHRVAWCGSWLSSDGTETCCHFRAPDAESVRIAARDAPSTHDSTWACHIHDAPAFSAETLLSSNVLVIRSFDEPVEAATIRSLEAAAAGLFDAHHVRFVRTHLSTSGRRMVCVYQAPDAGVVARVQQEAGMPFERIRAVRRYEP